MKTFTVVYSKTVREDERVEAKNEKEALRKFQKLNPDVRILDVHERDESLGEYYG